MKECLRVVMCDRSGLVHYEAYTLVLKAGGAGEAAPSSDTEASGTPTITREYDSIFIPSI